MEIKKNISTIFLVPSLEVPKNYLKQQDFINAYIKDILHDLHYQDCLYLLFKPKNLEKFKIFLEEEYIRTDAIIDEYDYEGGFIVVVYTLNQEFSKDYALVREGKYSKTSKKFQSLFPKFITYTKTSPPQEVVSLQYKVFNKDPELREHWENKLNVRLPNDAEVWGNYVEELEILDIESVKKTLDLKEI